MDQQTLSGITDIGFSLFFYVSKYCVCPGDAPSSGFLCDSNPDFASRVTNKLESVLVIPIAHPSKMHVHGFGEFLDNSFVDYYFFFRILDL